MACSPTLHWSFWSGTTVFTLLFSRSSIGKLVSTRESAGLEGVILDTKRRVLVATNAALIGTLLPGILEASQRVIDLKKEDDMNSASVLTALASSLGAGLPDVPMAAPNGGRPRQFKCTQGKTRVSQRSRGNRRKAANKAHRKA